MTDEIWKWIPGYEGLYFISNQGEIFSVMSKRKLHPVENYAGYSLVTLTKDRKHKTPRVSRLVAQAFVPNPKNFPQVNHKNEQRDDNRAENLEWCTVKYNCNYGMHNAHISKSRREKCHDGYRVKVKKTNDLEWANYKSIRQACEATGECRTNLRYKHHKIGMNVVYLNGYIYWLHPGGPLACGSALRRKS